jgi:DNA helicase-2/ATP-dependent DNA helicase PcrA
MDWSPHQIAVFDWMREGTGSRIVKAVAGSGKTSTIVHGLNAVRDNCRVLAFNSAIAKELAKRVPAGVDARTAHSACFRALRRAAPELKLNPNKLYPLARDMAGGLKLPLGTRRAFIANGVNLVSKAKCFGVGAILPDEPGTWRDVAERFDLDPDRDSLDFAHQLLAASVHKTRKDLEIDFDDQIYHVLLDDVRMEQFDTLCVDEAQDLSALNHEIVRRTLAPGGRVLPIGDPHQSIYAFRGADGQSFAHLAEMFHCQEMPLTVSFRCSQAVVAHAQSLVPYIEAFHAAPEGEVVEHAIPDWSAMCPSEDVVLCRSNAPLIKLALSLITRGLGVKILGKDITAGLKKLALRFESTSLKALRRDLDEWLAFETERLVEADQQAKVDAAADKHACLIAAMEALPPSATVDRLIERLDSLFDNRNGVLELATVHQAKGLEWERVHILRHDLLLPKWLAARAEREKETLGQVTPATALAVEQEKNLKYVAYTRAKHGLYILENGIERA